MACNKKQAIKNLGKYIKKGNIPWNKGKKEFFNPQNIKVFNENKQLIGVMR